MKFGVTGYFFSSLLLAMILFSCAQGEKKEVELETRIQILESQLNELAGQVTDLESDKEDLESRIDDLESESK